MDKRILMVLLALGVCPATFAQDTSTSSTTNSSFVIPMSSLKLHALTKLILQKLREQGALSIIESANGAQVVILGEKLDDDFFTFVSQMKNVTPIEGSKELLVSESLAAALAAFGELKDVLPENADEALLKDLQDKMGTKLEKTLQVYSGASFS